MPRSSGADGRFGSHAGSKIATDPAQINAVRTSVRSQDDEERCRFAVSGSTAATLAAFRATGKAVDWEIGGNVCHDFLDSSAEFAGKPNGRKHGSWVGEAFAGNPEGRAVIGAGPRLGQAESDVDGAIEI